MTDIIALPEMTRGLELRLWDAYHNNALDDADDPMEAVVEAYLSEAVRWQPIEPSDIKPGMRVRRTWCLGETVEYTVDTVQRVDIHGWIHLSDLALDLDIDATWEVDPRTIPIDPEEGQDLADHVERLEVALRLAQARNQDLEAALGRIREASEGHPECDRHFDSDVIDMTDLRELLGDRYDQTIEAACPIREESE